MANKNVFFDTNILLYLLSDDIDKANQAEALLSKGGVISVQVLNEFTSVAYRKLKMTYAEIDEILQTIRSICEVKDLTLDTHTLGLSIAERYGFSFYDSLILSAGVLAECKVLYSEDMQASHTRRSVPPQTNVAGYFNKLRLLNKRLQHLTLRPNNRRARV